MLGPGQLWRSWASCSAPTVLLSPVQTLKLLLVVLERQRKRRAERKGFFSSILLEFKLSIALESVSD